MEEIMKNKKNLAVLLLTGTMLLGVTSCTDTSSSLTTQGETDKKSSIVISDGIIGGEVSVVGDLTETNIGSDITITALPDFGYELLNQILMYEGLGKNKKALFFKNFSDMLKFLEVFENENS